MNHITKNTMDAYRVQSDHEWATIALQQWQSRGVEQGELLVHSSFGSWGYQWTNLGRPLKQFLAAASFDGIMQRLAAPHAREFDYDASMLAWKRLIVAARRRREITADQLNEIWDGSGCSEGLACGEELFLFRVHESRPVELGDHGLWDDCGEVIVVRTPSQQAVAFWEQLWPVFVAQLRQECSAANDAPAIAA